MMKQSFKNLVTAALCAAVTAVISFPAFAWGDGNLNIELGDLEDESALSSSWDERGTFSYEWFLPSDRRLLITSADSSAPPFGKEILYGLLTYSDEQHGYVTQTLGEPIPFEYDKVYTMFEGYEDEWQYALDHSADTVVVVEIQDVDDDLVWQLLLRLTEDTAIADPAPDDPPAAVPRWVKDETGWWYEYPNGTGSPANEWQYIDSKWYFFNEDGYCVNGWQKINGSWYEFDENGTLVSEPPVTGQP